MKKRLNEPTNGESLEARPGDTRTAPSTDLIGGLDGAASRLSTEPAPNTLIALAAVQGASLDAFATEAAKPMSRQAAARIAARAAIDSGYLELGDNCFILNTAARPLHIAPPAKVRQFANRREAEAYRVEYIGSLKPGEPLDPFGHLKERVESVEVLPGVTMIDSGKAYAAWIELGQLHTVEHLAHGEGVFILCAIAADAHPLEKLNEAQSIALVRSCFDHAMLSDLAMKYEDIAPLYAAIQAQKERVRRGNAAARGGNIGAGLDEVRGL